MKEVMTVEDLSEYLSIGKRKLYAMTEAREIPASRIKKQWRFRKEIINRWLDSLTVFSSNEFDDLIEGSRQDAERAGYSLADVDRLIAEVREERRGANGSY
jgi:excisionase family DNA binding protein